MTATLEGGECGQQHTLAVIYPRERPGTHCTGKRAVLANKILNNVIIYSSLRLNPYLKGAFKICCKIVQGLT